MSTVDKAFADKVVAATGCSMKVESAPSVLATPKPDGLREFRLGDGTRCVAFNDSRSGIACDWKASN